MALLNEPISGDFNHLDFGVGQPQAEITLEPGRTSSNCRDDIWHNLPVFSPGLKGDVRPSRGRGVPYKREQTAPDFISRLFDSPKASDVSTGRECWRCGQVRCHHPLPHWWENEVA
jgi:hypothetical protein